MDVYLLPPTETGRWGDISLDVSFQRNGLSPRYLRKTVLGGKTVKNL